MRVMCTGRIDLSFILRAFVKGVDGVFIGGCHLNECNYTTHGNFYALRITHLCKKLLELMGVHPERLRIAFISGGEGNRFAEIVNDFSETIQRLGKFGAEAGLDEDGLRFKLEAAMKLVPYIKLLERERFRVQYATEKEYADYFRSDEFNRLQNTLAYPRLTFRGISMPRRDRAWFVTTRGRSATLSPEVTVWAAHPE